MLISRFIQIDFADPGIKAVDEFTDIREAVRNAGLNLYSRFDIQLQDPRIRDGRVIVEVKIPESDAGSFTAGRRLRGISAYLLRRYKDKYIPHKVGDRLLVYADAEEKPSADGSLLSLTMVDRLDAVSRFALLLERNDDESLCRIEKIIALIEEDL